MYKITHILPDYLPNDEPAVLVAHNIETLMAQFIEFLSDPEDQFHPLRCEITGDLVKAVYVSPFDGEEVSFVTGKIDRVK